MLLIFILVCSVICIVVFEFILRFTRKREKEKITMRSIVFYAVIGIISGCILGLLAYFIYGIFVFLAFLIGGTVIITLISCLINFWILRFKKVQSITKIKSVGYAGEPYDAAFGSGIIVGIVISIIAFFLRFELLKLWELCIAHYALPLCILVGLGFVTVILYLIVKNFKKTNCLWNILLMIAACVLYAVFIELICGYIFSAGFDAFFRWIESSVFCLFAFCAVLAVFMGIQAARTYTYMRTGYPVDIHIIWKPRENPSYRGYYQCSRCYKTFSENTGTCPYCGVVFNSTSERYMPGTKPPKQVKEKSINTGIFSVICVIIYSIIISFYLSPFFNFLVADNKQTIPIIYILAGVIVNLYIILAALLLYKKYRKNKSTISRTKTY
jgi:hypothetical protein